MSWDRGFRSEPIVSKHKGIKFYFIPYSHIKIEDYVR